MNITSSFQQGILAIKSKENIFTEVTEQCAKLFNYPSPRHLKGLNDFQLSEYALGSAYLSNQMLVEDFMTEDEIAYRGKQFLLFEILSIHGKFIYALTHKSPYIPKAKVEGCCVHITLLPNIDYHILKHYLSNPDIYIPERTKKYIDVLNLVPHRRYQLTRRELQCLDLLCKGASYKQIASTLNLSRRTIESHINSIKDKLNVKKSTEIVAKTLSEKLL